MPIRIAVSYTHLDVYKRQIKTNAALLLVGIATFVLMGAGQSLYGPALPAFSRAFGVSIGQAGLLVSAHWIGCAIGVAGMFVWGARTTPRAVLILSLIHI